MEDARLTAGRLGPLSLGQILELSWRLYRGNFGTLILVSAVLLAPASALYVAKAYVDQQLGFYELLRQVSALQATHDREALQGIDWSPFVYYYVGWFGIGLVLGILGFATYGATSWIVCDRLLGGKAGTAAAYDFVMGRAGAVLGAAVLVVVERRGAGDALAGSRSLVEGSWWRVFGIWLAVGLIAGMATAIVTMPLSFMAVPGAPLAKAVGDMGAQMIVLPASCIVSAFTTPFYLVAMTLLYLDMRSRKEPDFDLAALALNLEREPPPPAAGSFARPTEASDAASGKDPRGPGEPAQR